MYGEMRTSALGLKASELRLQATGHNVANVNTHGFRRQEAGFSELIQQHIREQPVLRRDEAQLESRGVEFGRPQGLRARDLIVEDRAGAYQQTDRPLDLAVEGRGFFVLGNGRGEGMGLTRDGNFRLDDAGFLTSHDGFYVLDSVGEPLQLPDGMSAREIAISPTGELGRVHDDGTDGAVEIGTLALCVPESGQTLTPLGDNRYGLLAEDDTQVTGEWVQAGTEGAGEIRQGVLERSNVHLAIEMARLIEAQRSFQLNSRALSTSDQMFEMALHLRR